MWYCGRDVTTERVPEQAVATAITLLIAGRNVTSSTIGEMFKFDFVQEGDDDETQTAQSVKREANEPALTEISFIELVRAPRFGLLVTDDSSLPS